MSASTSCLHRFTFTDGDGAGFEIDIPPFNLSQITQAKPGKSGTQITRLPTKER
ncbi:MAG: hypothetical protein MI923_24815 [Phycisphaerales bacterium]|nr:hypothetical protein [Phycisphaerales bacterium]